MAKRSHKRQVLVLGEEAEFSARIADLLIESGHGATVYRNRVDLMGAITASAPDLVVICADIAGKEDGSFGATLTGMFDVPFVLVDVSWNEQRACAALESGALACLASSYPNLHHCAAMISVTLARHAELLELRHRSKHIVQALQHARSISTATGVLMERLHQGRREAFDTLRQVARSRRVRLIDSATNLLAAAEAINHFGVHHTDRQSELDCDQVHGSMGKSR